MLKQLTHAVECKHTIYIQADEVLNLEIIIDSFLV